MNHKPHVSKYKKEEIIRVKNLLLKYKVIAIADMTGMPSVQLQKLRSSIKESVLITMSKGRIIKIAFNELKDKIKGIDNLINQVKRMPALLLSNDSPFKLARILKKSKSSAPAKGGQIAPNDIMVPAGPTPFPPGPIMGELGQIGIKATVVDGKVAVKDDTIVVKEGQVISTIAANLLSRLGIEPMEIGINLLAALENGTIFAKEVLNVDEAAFMNNLKLAATSSFNLAFNITYPTKDNIKLLIKKAFMDSNGLADSKKILTSENVKKELAKANLEMESLKAKLNLPEEVVKETKPVIKEVKEEIKPVIKETKIEVKEEHHKVEKKSEAETIKTEEEVAKAVLKKLQDEKMAKGHDLPVKDKNFELEEKIAKEALKKAQDKKMK